MAYSVSTSVQYAEVTCWACGCRFAVEHELHERFRVKGETFSCPNGDRIRYGTPEIERLKKQVERQDAKIAFLHDHTDTLTRSNVALRGVVTRTKRRVATGRCPCCKRRFEDLAKHMHAAHPDYGE